MKRHYVETILGLLDMGSKTIALTPSEALSIIRDFNTLKRLRELAGTIPCDLCAVKDKNNVEQDGDCRHRPLTDTHINDVEVIRRFTKAITINKGNKNDRHEDGNNGSSN